MIKASILLCKVRAPFHASPSVKISYQGLSIVPSVLAFNSVKSALISFSLSALAVAMLSVISLKREDISEKTPAIV